MLCKITKERQPRVYPSVYGDGVRQGIPLFCLVVDPGQDQLLEDVVQNPCRNQRDPSLQEDYHWFKLPALPCTGECQN